MNNIQKLLVMVVLFTIMFSNTSFTQDNNNIEDINKEEKNDDNIFINENDLFGDDENDMINEVDENDLQNEITTDTVEIPKQDTFIINGKAVSDIKFSFAGDNEKRIVGEQTDFSMPISLSLDITFLIDELILGSLDFSLEYTPQYFSFNQQKWITDDFSINNLKLALDIKAAGAKVHSEFTFDYRTKTKEVNFGVDELFLDFSLNYILFFRIGKQDIKWGSGYRWSPTDFLNDERIDPLDPDEVFNPDGITGFSLTVPLDRFNVLLFIGNEDIKNILDTSITLRVEFAYDFFEISATAHYQKNIRSLFGFDVSAGGEFLYGTWNFWDEISFSMGSNRTFVDYDPTATDNKYYTYKTDLKTPYFKNVFGFNYNTGLLPEIICASLTFNFEYFYNGDGYIDPDMYAYALILQSQTGERLYEPFQMGRHYLTFSLMLSNIFSLPDEYSDFNFRTNLMINASDGSSILSFNISYSGIEDISISIFTDIYFAKEGTEFFFNNSMVQQMFLMNLANYLDPITGEVISYDNIIKKLFSIGFKFSYNF